MAEQHSDDLPLERHESITKQTSELAVKRAPDFVHVYGSQISVASTVWDVSVSVGQPVTDNPNDFHIEQRVLVSLSWHTAKALAHILLNNIRNHEQQYGEIRLTPLPTQADQSANE